MPQGTCSAPRCTSAVRCKGLCARHYAKRARPVCSLDDCEDPCLARSLCSRHYQQGRAARAAPCSVATCEQQQWARGLCAQHDKRLRTTGCLFPSTTLAWRFCALCDSLFATKARGEATRSVCRQGCERLAANLRSARWVALNYDRFRDVQRASYVRHRATRLAAHAAYAAANADLIAEKNAVWRAANRDRIAEAGRQYRAAHRNAYADKEARRRALKMRPDAEKVNRLVVFERDNWHCHLCQAPVDAALQWPDPESASIDHIVPLVAGGSHTYANIALAHLICNVRKGATV